MTKLLIVDDNRENLYLLQVLLSTNGFQVELTSNGAEALEQARRSPPDLIISDILMPVMDGFALCRAWKGDSRLKGIPFVFYTATYTDPKDEDFALSLGADRFIVKPAEPDKFLALLRETIETHKAGQPAAPRPPVEEAVYYKEYNAALIRKLEDKVLQLEEANRALELDITKRIRAEEALAFSNAVLSTQQETSLDGILVVDEHGKMISFNQRFLDIWRIPPEVAEARADDRAMQSVLSMVTDPKAFVARIKHLYEHREEKSREEIRLTDGRTLDRYSAPMFGQGGRYYGRVWYFRDITLHKQAEEEQGRLQAQLLQAQKMEAIGTLAGGVAHDFNNTLTAVHGYADLALMEVEPASPLHKDLLGISDSCKRAANLVRQLLLFSRRQPVQFAPLNLTKTVEDVLKMLRRLVGEDITIYTGLTSDLWDVMADAGNIEQVVMNLVVNARDAMPEGGDITVATRNVILDADQCRGIAESRPGKFVCLSVSDTGVGMTEEILERIFDPFFTTKEAGKGTGLGLAVVYGIVKQHDGWIRVNTRPGQGTTFEIYFPSSAETAKARAKEEVPLGQLQGKGERVLLVEDEEGVRTLAARVLRRSGYRVVEAGTGEEAVGVFEKEQGNFHLVFSDTVLPDRSGIQLLEELLHRQPNLGVLLSSGYTDEKSQWPVIQERGFRFLQKPYNMQDLLRATREAIEKAKPAH